MNEELSHEILHFIDRIDWRSTIKSQQWLSGRHSSLRRGASPEFKEFREYRSGEDLQQVDWKASARSKHRLVREKEHQGVLKQWIWIDTSASMDFPLEGQNKFRRIKLLCGALLYLFQSIGDRYSLVYENEEGPLIQAPTRGQNALQRQISNLVDLNPVQRAFTTRLLDQLKEYLHQASSIWLLTDFDSDPKEIIRQFSELKKLGHEVRLLHILHPDEAQFPWQGPHIFSDPESIHSELQIHPEELRKAYCEHYQYHLELIKHSCDHENLSYVRINVCDSPEDWISSLLSTLAP